MEKEEIKKLLQETLKEFKADFNNSIKKATIERNELLIKSIKKDYRDVNIESLIKDYINFEYLTDKDASINYSFITNRRLKKQLTIDNLQMEKARLGLINSSPDFLEFCKYAHFQLEGLVSFFTYRKTKGSLDNFKKVFPEIRVSPETTTLSRLPYNTKIKATNEYFKIYELKIHKLSGVRRNITKVRNFYLHRNIQQSIRNDFFKIKEDYFKDFPGGKCPDHLNKEDEKDKKKIDEYYTRNDEYYTMKTIREEDYIDVRNAVKDIAKLIKDDLEK